MNNKFNFFYERRSVMVKNMSSKPIPKADVDNILAAGLRVPDHGALNPWRIVVIQGKSLKKVDEKILLPEFKKTNSNADEEINFDIEGLPSGWSYCVLFSGNCLNSLNIAKGATSDFTLEITTMSNEPANVNGISLSLVGYSSLNDKCTNHDSFKIMTNPTYLFLVETPSDTKTGSSGDTIPFQLTVKNLGNDVDYINLPSPTLPSGWIGTYTESSFTLQPLESKTVYLNVKVPSNVFGGNSTITSKVSSDQSGQMSSIDFIVYFLHFKVVEFCLPYDRSHLVV